MMKDRLDVRSFDKILLILDIMIDFNLKGEPINHTKIAKKMKIERSTIGVYIRHLKGKGIITAEKEKNETRLYFNEITDIFYRLMMNISKKRHLYIKGRYIEFALWRDLGWKE